MDETLNSVRYREDDRLTSLLEDQRMETDEDERAEMISEAQELYAEDLPALTLYYPRWYWAHNAEVALYFTRGGISIGVPIPLNKRPSSRRRERCPASGASHLFFIKWDLIDTYRGISSYERA